MISFDSSTGSTSELHELLVRELAALDGSDGVLREMLAQTRGVLWIAEPATNRILYCSPVWSRIWGRPMSERPQTVADHIATVHPDDRPRNDALLQSASACPVGLEYRILRPDGTERWVRDTVFRIPGKQAAAERWAGFVQDITAEKRAAISGSRSEALFGSIAANAHTMLMLVDGQGIIRYASPAALPLLGYSESETLGKGASAFVHPHDLPTVIAALSRCMAEPDQQERCEVRALRKEGGHRVVELVGTNLLADPSVRSIVVTMRDITELREREADVRASEKRLRAVLDTLPVFVSILTPDGKLQFRNRAATTLGHVGDDPQMLGAEFGETPLWKAPDKRELLIAAIEAGRAGRASRFDIRFTDQHGVSRVVDFQLAPLFDTRGYVTHLVPVGVDVTERENASAALRQKEQEFVQAQKMEAVGRLAAGVAHDFNNIITAVMAYSDIVLTDLPVDNPSRADVEEIRKAADRAQALTRQLLAFSRHQVLEPKVFSLCQQVAGMRGMLARLVGEDITLSITTGDGSADILADPGHIEQVLLNLVVNARDAMPDGGTIEIVAECGAARSTAALGEWVRLTVRDTGCGMSPDVLKRVFEPFYTTKGPGEGTGLGLSTVYGIVKQSGGAIEVESEPGLGTLFTVYLPKFTGEAATETSENEVLSCSLCNGVGVLLVEDDSVVRAVSKRVLEGAGFQVIEATNGREGLDRLREDPGIALVVTDIVMPEMSGLEMVRQMVTVGATPAVLVTSGYTEDRLSGHGHVPAGARYLEKPFTRDALLEAARSALQTHVLVMAATTEQAGGTVPQARM